MGDDARRAYAAYRRAYRAMRMAEHVQSEQSARIAVALALRAGNPGSGDAADGLHELRLVSPAPYPQFIGSRLALPRRKPSHSVIS